MAALLCLLPLPAIGQAVPATPSAHQTYFEALGSLFPRLSDAKAFPRVWQFESGATLRARGRLDYDSIWSIQSGLNESLFGDLGNAFGVRRGRAGIEGNLRNDWRYVAEIDLASGGVVPQDVFLGHQEANEGSETRIGHYREMFSLEGNTSANFLNFRERSSINTLDPGRSWGISQFACDCAERKTLAAGFFFAGTGPAGIETGPGATAALTTRFTMAPILEGNGRRLVHFGVALSERLALNQEIVINPLQASPLLDLGNSTVSPFVPRLSIPADFQQLLNVQFAAAKGPLWIQSEWYGTLIPRSDGGLVFIRGSYVSCGYFLTGEHRPYQRQRGVFGGVNVNRPVFCSSIARGRATGWGAWELVSRFAYENIAGPDLLPGQGSTFEGVRLAEGTFGLNWYLTDRIRMLFDCTHAVPDTLPFGTSSGTVLATRLNVFW